MFYLLPHHSHQLSWVLAEFTGSGSAVATLANSASPKEAPQGQAHLQLFQENKKNKYLKNLVFHYVIFISIYKENEEL